MRSELKRQTVFFQAGKIFQSLERRKPSCGSGCSEDPGENYLKNIQSSYQSSCSVSCHKYGAIMRRTCQGDSGSLLLVELIRRNIVDSSIGDLIFYPLLYCEFRISCNVRTSKGEYHFPTLRSLVRIRLEVFSNIKRF